MDDSDREREREREWYEYLRSQHDLIIFLL